MSESEKHVQAKKEAAETINFGHGNWESAGFETRAIHAGQDPDPTTGAVVVPIYQTSTYVQSEVGHHKGYEYSRTGNPTRAALESCLASLEGGKYGLAYGSGMAATTNVMYLLKPGDHVILSDDVYGGTYRLFARVLTNYGLTYTLADMTDPAKVKEAVRPETKLLWGETPTNPWLKIFDIAALADIAHESGALFAVDNTFASPYIQQPLKLGADLVVHSSTKYLGGHSDVVGGILALNDEKLREKLAFYQNAIGAIPGPFDSWLVLRGLKTLAVRLEAHSANALAIAQYLEGHPKVTRVYYPGLPNHPQYELAKRQMRLGGGMISFEHRDGQTAALQMVARTHVFSLAESLGGVESLIEHPGAMTHASLAGTSIEMNPSLVRLSVGIESRDDLLADLAQALG